MLTLPPIRNLGAQGGVAADGPMATLAQVEIADSCALPLTA